MTTAISFPYYGRITGVVGTGNFILFTTTQADQKGAIHQLNASAKTVTHHSFDLPNGLVACCQWDERYLIAADQQGQFYRYDFLAQADAAESLEFRVNSLDQPVLQLARWQDRLVALQATGFSLWNLDTHGQAAQHQFIAHPERLTVMAISADQAWLAVGDSIGQIATFYLADSQTGTLGQAVQSAIANIHEDEVTALCFDPQQQVFFSAGQDRKLYRTHAQGDLQPLDRGKKSNHELTINALLAHQDHLYSAADDQRIKAWPLINGTPTTFAQELAKVQRLALIQWDGQTYLVASTYGQQQNFNLIRLDDQGQMQDIDLKIRDGYHWLETGLKSTDPKQFEIALAAARKQSDQATLQLIVKQLKKHTESQTSLSLLSVLIDSDQDKANTLLARIVEDANYAPLVRMDAFEALIQRATGPEASAASQLHYADLALTSQDIKLSKRAIALLIHLQRDSQAIAAQAHRKLTSVMLTHALPQVRNTALNALEQQESSSEPVALLAALASQHEDLVRSALIRLYQQDLHLLKTVRRQLFVLQQDKRLAIRQTAFLIHVLSQPTLAKQLAALDSDVARRLADIEQFQLPLEENTPALASRETKLTQQINPAQPETTLTTDQLEPLLQNLANPYIDISFEAAKGLATLRDTRAFGTLLLLAQSKDDQIRSGVAMALGRLSLPDAQSILQGMLNDHTFLVRSAAFNALQHILASALDVITIGFTSRHEDIHALALKLLLDQLQYQPVQEATFVLQKGLNDPFEPIRLQVAKACFNRYPETIWLPLLLESHFVDIHRLAFETWQSQVKTDKAKAANAQSFLALWFNDPYEAVQDAALDFSYEQRKYFSPQAVLQHALSSSLVAIRTKALQLLLDQPAADHDVLLSKLFDDSDETLRHAAINAAITLVTQDAANLTLLTHALSSPYSEIQLAAARALAHSADDTIYQQVCTVFEKYLSATYPTDSLTTETQAQKLWKKQVRSALIGLAELEKSSNGGNAFKWFEYYVTHPQFQLDEAAYALVWVCQGDQAEQLHQWLQHHDKQLASAAALALAVLGDQRSWFTVESELGKLWTPLQRLMAINGLGFDQVSLLEKTLNDKSTQRASEWLTFAHALIRQPDTPDLLIQSLALKPTLALHSAALLMRFTDQTACWDYLTEVINQWRHTTAHHETASHTSAHHFQFTWQLTPEQLEQWAYCLVKGSPHLKARAIELAGLLDQTEVRFDQWLSRWEQLQLAKHGAQLKTQYQRAINNVLKRQSQAYWQALASGALLAIVNLGKNAVREREQAIRQLMYLAGQAPERRADIALSLSALLADQAQSVRTLIFDSLSQLGVTDSVRAEWALASPYQDMTQQGLQLVLKHLPADQIQQVLTQLLQSNDALLAAEAANQLEIRDGLLAATQLLLRSNQTDLSLAALDKLIVSINQPDVLALLWETARHADDSISLGAISLLKKHVPQQRVLLNEVILSQLELSQAPATQQRLINLLDYTAFTPELVIRLLQQLDHPQAEQSRNALILTLIGQTRNAAFAPILLKRLGLHRQKQKALIDAIYTISGYDQIIYDKDKDPILLVEQDKQFPRHADILIALCDYFLSSRQYDDFNSELANLSWTPSAAVDALLLRAFNVLPRKYRPALIEAAAWRAEKRQGDLTALARALSDRDPIVQFLAAEALAKRKRPDGASILMAAIDQSPMPLYRKRAVLALGELGQTQTYAKLLKLAETPDHFLQQVAIEALGHLGQGDQRDELLKLIEQQLDQLAVYSPDLTHLLNGLRWLNLPQGWQIIRRYAKSNNLDAISLLRHHADPTSEAVLLELLENSSQLAVVAEALASAQHLWGNLLNQPYPYDFALLQNARCAADTQLTERSLKRVIQHGETSQLLTTLIKLGQIQELIHLIRHPLLQALLQRNDLSSAVLEAHLQSSDLATIQLSVVYLIAHPALLAQSTLQQQVESQLMRATQRWQVSRDALAQADKQQYQRLKQHHSCEQIVLEQLWQLVGRTLDVTPVIEAAAEIILDTGRYFDQSTRHAQAKLQTQLLKGLLARPDGLSVSWQRLLQRYQDWRQLPEVWIQPLVSQLATSSDAISTTAPAATHDISAQLLSWVQSAQVAPLQALACDETQLDAPRLSAIEALSQIDDPTQQIVVENALKTLTTLPDSDLAKAAYRALRRWQRRHTQKARKAALDHTTLV